MPRISRETPLCPRSGQPDEVARPDRNAGQAHLSSSKGSSPGPKPLPSLCAPSAPDANLTYMIFKGHVLPGYTHVGLGDARLDDHFPQELRIEPSAGEESREENDESREDPQEADRLWELTGLTSAWPRWKSMRLSPKGGSSGGSAQRTAQLWRHPCAHPGQQWRHHAGLRRKAS